jgi:predicted ATPase
MDLEAETNVLIGINGSGKTNLFRLFQMVEYAFSGAGLAKFILERSGGLDNILYHGDRDSDKIRIELMLDHQKVNNYGFVFGEDLIYEIELAKVNSTQNYTVTERFSTISGFEYLSFKNGKGKLTEISESGKATSIGYDNFDSQELALAKVNDSDRYWPITTLSNAFKEIIVYRYFDTTENSGLRKPVLATSGKKLSSDGSNLIQIINTLKINYKSDHRKILNALKEVNPNFDGIDLNLVGTQIELMLEEKGLNKSVHVSNLSDGTLRFLCLLSIFCNPQRGGFICIDEPEVGLHPDMLLLIADLAKAAGEESTILLSTHSELLLNHFDLNQIRVFERTEDGGTEVKSFDKGAFSEWFDQYSLGQLWRNGSIGGVRYGS